MPDTPVKPGQAEQRQLAATIFNHVWDLLEKPDRSLAEDDEMLHGAHASRYHWGVAGEPVHWARGEWQCARVYAVLGRAEPALHHAGRCLSSPPSTTSARSTLAPLTRRSPVPT